MEISELKTLISLVETGSVTATARELNRVPSAITSRIQQLEDHLGIPLFYREKKRLIVTSKALELYEYACQIVKLVNTAELNIKTNCPGGKFRIGALESIAATRLPLPLTKLYEGVPNIELELITGIRDTLYNALINGQHDAILIGDAPFDEKLERVTAFEEELIIIASKNHTEIKKPHDIKSSNILVFREGCSYRDRLLNWYHSFNSYPKRVTEVTSYHAILGSVAAGMGIGIVPKIMFDQFSNKHLLSKHAIEGPLGQIKIELIWKKGWLSANIIALQSILAYQKYPKIE
ncbi:LysR family transcriptional regulator [Acinetobacter gerneri]|uniref:LysR family transcriptional regulator n=1 Tax=Acinetobacter gerneri TaxID=202952 RepID=UPI003A885796